MEDIVFLFGAGAEYGEKSYGLPSGPEYTLKTMRQKRDKLYTALRKFYTSDRMGSYVREYRPEFLFKKDSHTFRELVYRAAIACIDDNFSGGAGFEDYVKCVYDHEKYSLEWDESTRKEKRDSLKEHSERVYNFLINDDSPNPSGNNQSAQNTKEKTLKDYLSFYGAVEKDFGSIIDPNRIGLTQFWRVINYYWSAFFTILEPLCTDLTWYQKCNGDSRKFYDYVLNNLASVIDDIYSNYDYSVVESADLQAYNYYLAATNFFPHSAAVTTNYTPFVEHYFSQNAYLAGRLAEFEFPTELEIQDIRDSEVLLTNFIFPFLMTQAPVKPIVSPKQLREYAKALDYMKKANTLVIIGYSLGDADNHINAILREYATDEKKRVIYCFYDSSNSLADDSVLEYVQQSLKLTKTYPNIMVLRNNGNATDLMYKLKKITENIE